MKNKLLYLTALLLTCCTLTLTVSAEGDTPEVTPEVEAIVTASEPNVAVTAPAAPPYPAEENTGSDTAPKTESPAIDPIEPIEAPVPNETAPNETEPKSFWSDLPEGTGSIENISEYWETNGYPDDVSFVADHGIATYYPATQTEVIDYLWTIGTVNMSSARKAEICALIAAGQHLQFVDCTYSYNQRVKIKNELESIYPKAVVELTRGSQSIEVYLDKYEEEEKKEIVYDIKQKYDSGIVLVMFSTPTIGIPEIGELDVEPPSPEVNVEPTTAQAVVTDDILAPTPAPSFPGNIVDADPVPDPVQGIDAIGTEVQEEEQKAEDNIGINASGLDIGGETAIASNNDFVLPTEGIRTTKNPPPETFSENGMISIIANDAQKENNSLWLWLCSAAAAAALITAAIVIGKRHSKALSLADGGEIQHKGKIGRAETVKAVKESTVEPSEKTYSDIIDKINKSQNNT